ncbi:hypothetical protein NDU88_005657 [Pleurodeles waltl]|uniref:Uncharacterized protein n=1 Tax=Pleurodeles waltl TaxID=8319 RepID=A0AAV7UJV3_PLEWA|nr:hypothetical protein NDU88_005657 [Pleurodeles waltl]
MSLVKTVMQDDKEVNLRILDKLQMTLCETLCETKPLPRPAQFEALAVWEIVARQQQEIKFKRRIKKVEKSLAEARWDWEQKRWRTETLQGIKLFPAIAEDESEKEDTTKGDESTGTKKKKQPYVEDEDSDVEDLITQLFRDQPPPYATRPGGPGNSSASTAPAQASGTLGPVQTDSGQVQGIVQSTPNAGITSVVQAQMHPPSIQIIYPDESVLETITNLVVPLEQVLLRPTLVQTESTPVLLPLAQPQGIPKFTPLTGTQSDVTPVVNQTMGVTFPQGTSVRADPDAISLLITVGPAVPLFAQKKASAGD